MYVASRISPIRTRAPYTIRHDRVMGATVMPVRELGRGGFGIAILARPSAQGRSGSPCGGRSGSPIAARAAAAPTTSDFVVVKYIRIATMNAADRERTLTEVAILKKLTHPAIVRCIDAWIEDAPGYEFRGHLGIAMEYCDGGDLAKLLSAHRAAGTRMPIADVTRMLLQLLEGLEYVHGSKILHRDIKPANVFLTDGARRAVLGDFGVSKQLDHTAQQAMTWIGTPCFMAPELFRGLPYDSAADVWSLGVTAYEMLLGELPFPKDPAQAVTAVQVHDPTPALRALCFSNPDSQRVAEAVIGMLRKKGIERPTARALIAALSAGALEPPAASPAGPDGLAAPIGGGGARGSPLRVSPIRSPVKASPAAKEAPSPPPPPPALDKQREMRHVIVLQTRRTLATPKGATMGQCLGSTRLTAVIESTMAIYENGEERAMEVVSGLLRGIETPQPHDKCIAAIRAHYFQR